MKLDKQQDKMLILKVCMLLGTYAHSSSKHTLKVSHMEVHK